jgi:hypothetical protein
MNFTVRAFVDGNKGTNIQFIPDSKTSDFSKNEQVDAIMSAFKKKVPFLADIIFYYIESSAAGLTFRLDAFGLTDKIEKALK